MELIGISLGDGLVKWEQGQVSRTRCVSSESWTKLGDCLLVLKCYY